MPYSALDLYHNAGLLAVGCWLVAGGWWLLGLVDSRPGFRHNCSVFFDPYGHDVLNRDPHHPAPPQVKDFPAEKGAVLEHIDTGFVGAVIRTEKSGGIYLVELEDRRGRRRSFPLGTGFLVDGLPVNVVPFVSVSAQPRRKTNSGSVRAPERKRAKVARASRIWVEGRHDAELVQHVWGEDLADVGVVVEMLDGADNLEDRLSVFGPSDDARVGVLLDHMVQGSKETRIAQRVRSRFGESVLIVGHPFVDIWQAVKAPRVGLVRWPDIPRGVDIKVGSLQALGWPARTSEDIGLGWQRILRQVRDYRDLDPQLLGRVEELIDFVTAD